MKSTGMIRHIDELGRIVIPKEIRSTLQIRQGEDLEIFINNDEIMLKKFSMMPKIENYAQDFVDIIYNIDKKKMMITDKNKIIACPSPYKKEYCDKLLSKNYIDFLNDRKERQETVLKNFKIISLKDEYIVYYLRPIIINSDIVGSIIIFSDNLVNDSDKDLAKVVSQFIIKRLEN